jgi:hypothetical protein
MRAPTFAFLSVVVTTVLLIVGCREADKQADRFFQKKLECGRFLDKIEGSVRGPNRPPEAILLPVVFYSPSLNTCLYVHNVRMLGSEFDTLDVELIDLLTGRVLETHQFDLKKPSEFSAAARIHNELMKVYGTPEEINFLERRKESVRAERLRSK